MKVSRFFKGLSWLIFLNLLIKPVWIFAIDRQVQNTVGQEAYGAYFSILNLSLVLSFLADAGLTNMLNRQLAIKQPPHLKQLVSIKCALSAFYFAVLFFICWLTHIIQWKFVLLIGTIQVLTSFLLFFRGILTGQQLFKQDAWISVIDKVFMIVVCGSLLYLPYFSGLSIFQYLYLQVIGLSIAVLIAFFIAYRHFQFDTGTMRVKHLLRQTIPFVLLIMLMAMHVRLDGFLLERIHHNGAYEAGIYASAFRLLDAGNMLGYLAASFLVPFAAHHLADKEAIKKAVRWLRHGLLTIGLSVVVVMIFFAKPIVAHLYFRSDAYQAQVLMGCIAALPAYYLIHLYGSLLTAKGLFKNFSLLVLICVAINVVLNLLLIPHYGAKACVAAALTSQYACAFWCANAASHAFQLPLHWRSAGIYLLGSLFLIGLCFLLKNKSFSMHLFLALPVVTALSMFVMSKLLKKNFIST